ncbi:MAG: GTPase HflX, partial [Thermotogae bacterium]
VILIKDTVGFIRNVPHTVVEAFKSTLEEITTCDLVLLVMDASDVDISSKMKACLDVLSEIGASDIRRILVFNKVDLCSSSRLRALSDAFPEAVFISCKSGYGIDFLLARIQNTILANEDQIELRVVPDKLSILESHKEKVSMNIEGFEEGLFIVKVKGKKWLIEHILSQLDGGMKK